jgi:DNA-binding MarR family transcriptional regulator
MSSHETTSLYPRVRHLINTILSLEKGRIFQVDGQRVYPSEVHLLLEVARQPDITATDLACNLAVTKGAVSQTISRLADKGLLIKARTSGMGNSLRLDLTPRGMETVAHFREKTAGLRSGVEEHLAGLSSAQRKVVAEFLDRLIRELEDLGQV